MRRPVENPRNISVTIPGNISANISGDLRALDRRDWQLWGISCIIIASLAAGFLLLHLSMPAKTASSERLILYGQGLLILLTLAYLLQKRSELVRVRVRLIQEKLQKESLRDRYDALGNTLAFTTRVGVLKDENRILQYSAEQTLTTLRADQCMIGILEEGGSGPPPIAAHIAREGIDGKDASSEAWEPTARWILSNDTSLLLSRKSSPAEAEELERQSLQDEIIAAPIRLSGRAAGVLLVTLNPENNETRRLIGQYDRRLVEIIANATSASIDNCRLADHLKRRRDQLRKSLKRLRLAQPGVILGERLKAMEELVDKVAHYISNPLTTISGYAQLLGTQELDEDMKRCLSTIGEEVERCNQAINDLKAFAHRPPSEPRSTDLNQLLKQALFLKAYRFNRLALDVKFDSDPDIGLVVLDPVQVQQAFLNVLTDLENALENHKNQHLVVQTEHDAKNVRVRFVVKRNDEEKTEAASMPAWVPFSPNEEGKEEGNLTRDILHAVVGGHGGQTHLDLDPETGTTTFTIDLPRVLEPAASEPDPDEPVRPGVQSPEKGRILVVDDEERILNLFSRVLTKEGFDVRATVSGQEALDLLDHEDFKAVILDFHMPDMDGSVIAEHLGRHRPELLRHLILTSGDDESKDFLALKQKASALTLSKPFQIQEMLTAVNEAIA